MKSRKFNLSPLLFFTLGAGIYAASQLVPDPVMAKAGTLVWWEFIGYLFISQNMHSRRERVIFQVVVGTFFLVVAIGHTQIPMLDRLGAWLIGVLVVMGMSGVAVKGEPQASSNEPTTDPQPAPIR